MTFAPAQLHEVPAYISPFEWLAAGLSPQITQLPQSSFAWPAANRAYYYPIVVPQPVTAYKMAYWSVSGSGNVDLGIYDETGVRLVSTGSVAANSTFQVNDITDTVLAAGRYFIGIAASATAVAVVGASGAFGGIEHGTMSGIRQESSAFPLPSTATFAAFATTTVFWCAIQTRSTDL